MRHIFPKIAFVVLGTLVVVLVQEEAGVRWHNLSRRLATTNSVHGMTCRNTSCVKLWVKFSS